MIEAILIQLAAVAASRAGLSGGQVQLVTTGLAALLNELATLDPSKVSEWLASLPPPADTGDPHDDAPFGTDTIGGTASVPFVPLPEDDPVRQG